MAEREKIAGHRRWHFWGVVSMLWGVATWLEWILMPVLFPSEDGAVTHDHFTRSSVVLAGGCVVFLLTILCAKLKWKHRLLYWLAPASYIIYQIVRISV